MFLHARLAAFVLSWRWKLIDSIVEPRLSGPRLSERSIIRTCHNAVYTDNRGSTVLLIIVTYLCMTHTYTCVQLLVYGFVWLQWSVCGLWIWIFFVLSLPSFSFTCLFIIHFTGTCSLVSFSHQSITYSWPPFDGVASCVLLSVL